jgi:hypothetical protein
MGYMRRALRGLCALAAVVLAAAAARADILLTNNGGCGSDYGVDYVASPAQSGWPAGAVLTDHDTRTAHFVASSLRWPPGQNAHIDFKLHRTMLVTEVAVWFSGALKLALSFPQEVIDCDDAEWHRVDHPASSWVRIADLAFITDRLTLDLSRSGGPVEITEVEIWGEPQAQVTGLGDARFSLWPPVAGRPVTVSVAVRNIFEAPLSNIPVKFYAVSGGSEVGIGQSEPAAVAAHRSRRAAITWRPDHNGLQVVRATCPGMGELRVEVPVVQRRLYFAWYGVAHGQPLKWVNVAMHPRGLDAERWIERGAMPLSWAGGYCYKEKTEDEFVAYWSEALAQSERGIAIDEFGCDNGGAVDRRMATALRRVKSQHPDSFILAWNAGHLPDVLTAGYRESADLIVPEVYMQYVGWLYPAFDGVAKQARAAGIAGKTVFGLCTTTDKGGVTKEQLERQFRYIKRVAPEFPGVAFFNAYRVASGMLEWADELCYRYFILPVLTVERGTSGRWRLRNIGGVDAEHVWVKWGPHGEPSAVFPPVPAGGSVVLRAPAGGARPIIVESLEYTVLRDE